MLFQQLSVLDQGRLTHTCFQVSIDGLRSVPLDILKRLEAVPEAYLQELGEDHDLFAELPASVQRQVRPVHVIRHASLYHITNSSAGMSLMC